MNFHVNFKSETEHIKIDNNLLKDGNATMNSSNAAPFKRTDLASEWNIPEDSTARDGYVTRESMVEGIRRSELDIISDAAATALEKPRGRYITLDVGRIWTHSNDALASARELLAREIRSLVHSLCGSVDSVLVAGIGNRSITPDAVGPICTDHIHATRHVKLADPSLYARLGGVEIAVTAPGVVGQTGIETLELVRGAVWHTKPSLLIVIDALAARSTERLATTVQLSDSGIRPGSGIGNSRRALDRGSVGVPVIAIGVPTVVDSSTLVYDALEKAGLESYPDKLIEVLDGGRDFFVSLNESDIAVNALARLIGEAVNLAFLNVT